VPALSAATWSGNYWSANDVQLTCIDSFDPFYRRQLKLLNIDGFEKHHNFFLRDIDLDTVTIEELHQALPQPIDVDRSLGRACRCAPQHCRSHGVPAYQYFRHTEDAGFCHTEKSTAVCICLFKQRVWRKQKPALERRRAAVAYQPVCHDKAKRRNGGPCVQQSYRDNGLLPCAFLRFTVPGSAPILPFTGLQKPCCRASRLPCSATAPPAAIIRM
jgi:hypothetical protein